MAALSDSPLPILPHFTDRNLLSPFGPVCRVQLGSVPGVLPVVSKTRSASPRSPHEPPFARLGARRPTGPRWVRALHAQVTRRLRLAAVGRGAGTEQAVRLRLPVRHLQPAAQRRSCWCLRRHPPPRLRQDLLRLAAPHGPFPDRIAARSLDRKSVV